MKLLRHFVPKFLQVLFGILVWGFILLVIVAISFNVLGIEIGSETTTTTVVRTTTTYTTGNPFNLTDFEYGELKRRVEAVYKQYYMCRGSGEAEAMEFAHRSVEYLDQNFSEQIRWEDLIYGFLDEQCRYLLPEN